MWPIYVYKCRDLERPLKEAGPHGSLQLSRLDMKPVSQQLLLTKDLKDGGGAHWRLEDVIPYVFRGWGDKLWVVA